MSVRRRQWRDRKTGAKKESWEVDVVFMLPNGQAKRVRRSSPVQTRRGAEEYERQLRGSLLDGSYGKEPEEPVPTLEEFVPRFMIYVENNNKPSTVSNKKHVLRDHLIPAFGKMQIDQIGFAEIEVFKADMRKKASTAAHRKANPPKWAIKKRYGGDPKVLSDKTINNALSCLRKMLNVAVEWEIIQYVPRVKLFKTDKPPFDFLTFEEAERLVAATDREWRTMILLALKSGLRQGELVGLQWTDIDLVQGRVNVRRSIWKGIVGTPKGGRSRTVEIPKSLVSVLKTYRHWNGPYVFCEKDGTPLVKDQLKAPLLRALRKSGISRDEGKIGWHDLRHTYASHLAMRGVSLKVIQELLGHASIEMTLKYAHLTPELKNKAVQVLDEPVTDKEEAPARQIDGNAGTFEA